MIYSGSKMAFGHPLRLASLSDMLPTSTGWPHSVIQAYLVFSLPQSWTYPLLQGAYNSFSWNVGLRSQDLGTGVLTADEVLMLLPL